MRVFFSGPRVAGIRPGISFGREDFGNRPRTSARRAPAQTTTGSFVYVVNDGHRVKVGSSSDPNRRMRELQTGNPRQLHFSFVGVTPGPGYDIELKAHDMLASYGAGAGGGSEWYDTSPEIAAAALMGAAGQIKQNMLAISPNQIGQILQIANGIEKPPLWRRIFFWLVIMPIACAWGALVAVVLNAVLHAG